MRTLGAFAVGLLAGAIGVVLWFTVDPDFEAETEAVAGGGNITVAFDERALAMLVAEQVATLPGFGERPAVSVEVLREGVIEVGLGAGVGGVGARAMLVFDPNVVEGRLRLDVVRATLGELAAPEVVVGLIEPRIQARMDAAAGDLSYRLVAIRTTDRRLTLELAIE